MTVKISQAKHIKYNSRFPILMFRLQSYLLRLHRTKTTYCFDNNNNKYNNNNNNNNNTMSTKDKVDLP